MRGRGQLLATVVVVALVVAGAAFLQRDVGAKAFAPASSPAAPSGAWFCPHGGGAGWETTLEVANPGERPVDLRVTGISDARPATPSSYTVRPGTSILVPAASRSRASASVVEYFGGWVAAGWVSRAGGGENGVAAEPCSPSAGSRWLLPDGTTRLLQNTSKTHARVDNGWIVVMNPFASDAVVSLTLYTDDGAPVRPGKWTNVALKPRHAEAFYLNSQREGFATVSTVVDTKVGRVVASSLGVSDLGGVRASLGQLAPVPATAVLPGGADQGRSELVEVNTGTRAASLTGTVLGRRDPVPLSANDRERTNADAAQTIAITTDGVSALDLSVPPGTAVARRTFGKVSDQAATGPAVPATSWVVLPAVAGEPSHAGMVLTNAGQVPADVRLSYLPSGAESPPSPITVSVPPLRTVAVPSAFVQARPRSAVFAVASTGAFVPAAASYSFGIEGYGSYAVALGVPITGRRP
jgi:hypothetical protein